MHIDYSKALAWLRGTALALAGFVVVTIAGGFILQLCVGSDWYEHPWATVARMIAFIHWFLGNSYVRWIGGAVIGFALGIWIDDLLRRLAERAPPLVPPPLEKGFLDFQIDLVRAQKQMVAILEAASKSTLWIANEATKHTPKVAAVTAKMGGDSTGRYLIKANKIADHMASKNDTFANKIEQLNEKFRSSSQLMINAIQWLHDNNAGGFQNNGSNSAIMALRNNCQLARENIRGFVEALRGSRGVNGTLTRSIDRATTSLDRFIETISGIITLCTALLGNPKDANP